MLGQRLAAKMHTLWVGGLHHVASKFPRPHRAKEAVTMQKLAWALQGKARIVLVVVSVMLSILVARRDVQSEPHPRDNGEPHPRDMQLGR